MVSSSLANNPLQKNTRKRVHKNCSNDGIVQVLLQPFQRLGKSWQSKSLDGRKMQLRNEEKENEEVSSSSSSSSSSSERNHL
jgi:hypothetical protein